jgi:ubiquinone/menaquinone biosynthesis C-methylase UbiE
LRVKVTFKRKSKERYAVSHPTDPRREHPSTYFVQDCANTEELGRLQIQGQMITASMAGVLPEQPDPTLFERVLDVGCGTGEWLIEAAKSYPSMKRLVGVDINYQMIDYARSQAAAQQISDRVEFHTMDALRMLEFPKNSFDLVNLRYGMSWLRTWDWPKLLQEVQRVTQPDGVIRVTDSDLNVERCNPALKRLSDMFVQAFYQSGHLFTPDGNGLICHLAHLLHQQGCKNVQTRSHTVEFRADTPQGQRFSEDVKLMYRTIVPFLRRWTRLPDDYEQIYQQMLSEVQRPDFVKTVVLLTTWGNKP